MRFRQIITEAPRYEEMLTGLKVLNEPWVEQECQSALSFCKYNLKNKKDRTQWYMRWFRYSLVIRWYREQIKATTKAAPEQVTLVDKLSANYMKALRVPEGRVVNELRTFENGKEDFAHIASHQSVTLQNFVWSDQSPTRLIADAADIEEKWQAKQNQVIHYTSHDDTPEIFLDLGNGWAWFDLNTASCDQESKAMGHCGNSAGKDTDNVLSLRSKSDEGDFAYRPSLTFILHEDGMLGEMKARNNQKPDKKYNSAIIALLMDRRIKGIVGGGYKPENNFSLDQLSDEERQAIWKVNPYMRDLGGLYEWYWEVKRGDDEGDPVEILKRIKNGIIENLKRWDYDFVEVDMEREVIVCEKLSIDTYLSYYNSLTKFTKDLIDEKLPELMAVKFQLVGDRAESICARIEKDRYMGWFKELVGYDCDYQLSDEMHAELHDDGLVYVELPIEDFMQNLVIEPWDRKPESLTEVVDRDADTEQLDYMIEEESDPLTYELLQYLKSILKAFGNRKGKYATIDWPEPSDDLVETFYDVYKNKPADRIVDPDQPELDFGN